MRENVSSLGDAYVRPPTHPPTHPSCLFEILGAWLELSGLGFQLSGVVLVFFHPFFFPKAVQVVRPAPPAAPTLELSQTLYVVTDVLLTSFSSAVAAMAQRDVPARTALLAAYRDVRAQLGWELLEDAKAELKATGWGASESGGRVGPLPPDLLMWWVKRGREGAKATGGMKMLHQVVVS